MVENLKVTMKTGRLGILNYGTNTIFVLAHYSTLFGSELASICDPNSPEMKKQINTQKLH